MTGDCEGLAFIRHSFWDAPEPSLCSCCRGVPRCWCRGRGRVFCTRTHPVDMLAVGQMCDGIWYRGHRYRSSFKFIILGIVW